jgi:sigma-B regulation protein RsbU (phosphoserine phosphatase)
MIPGAEYRIGRAQLDPGDFLVAYTDGVTEARNNDKVLFTEARLLQVLEEIVGRETGLNATAILGLIEKAVDIHVAGAASSDDTTMLAVKRSL